MPKSFASAIFFLLLSLSLAVPGFPQESDRPVDKSVEKRVESLLSQMTLEEKIELLGGVDEFFIRGVPRLGVPRMKLADGPFGVRNFGPATAMPGGIALAATWDPDLVRRVGEEIGRDARSRGVHFLLGPGVNMYRGPLAGRNFEYFGEDPFLASRTVVGYINGLQSQGVSATVKHLVGNDSEFDRHNTDSIIDERTLHEIYLPAFEAAVKEAHVGAVMDAYNLLNGTHTTENAHLNNDIVKGEWSFDGIIMSDWNSTYRTVGAANGGMDMEMPSGKFFDRAGLEAVIREGKVTVGTIDDKVRRILRTAVRFGWLDRDQTDPSIPRYNLAGREIALQAARESMVLLKNERSVLPLDKKKIRSVAVIGPDAHPVVAVGGGSARVEPFAGVSFLEGLTDHLGASVPVYYNRGLPTYDEIIEGTKFTTDENNGERGLRGEYFTNPDLAGSPAAIRTDRVINFRDSLGPTRTFPDKTLSIRWSGYFLADEPGDYEICTNGHFYRLIIDGKVVIDDLVINKAFTDHATIRLDAGPHKIVLERGSHDERLGNRMQLGIVEQSKLVDAQAKKIASMADVVVLAVGFDPGTESEGEDRTFDLPIGQDELIREIAAANKNTIVVLTSGGGVDMNPWLDKVPALVEAWYPGQEGGRALAEVLFGDVNPSGRLPVTFERRLEDNPTFNSYYPEPGSNKVNYKEGIFVGYRGFDRTGTKPLFPFGYGLSYTTFKYNNLAIKPIGGASEIKYEVSFDVTNTGTRSGAEVAQIYVGEEDPKIPRPAKELKGFTTVFLKPGETKRVIIILETTAFSYYDVNRKHWLADTGKYEVFVGRSVEEIKLRGSLTLGAAILNR
jgi:beta-glucosidase